MEYTTAVETCQCSFVYRSGPNVDDKSMAENNTPNAKPTITDVGREAGVSQTAVSYVLSGSHYAERLKPETRRKVLEAAVRLGYRRNSVGAALKRGYSDTVVLLAVTWELASAYSNMIIGMTRAAASRGLTLNVHVAADDAEAARLLENLTLVTPYGLILVWDSISLPSELLTSLRDVGLPIVDVLPSTIPGIASLTPDREQGWYIGTRHLIDLGHERIGFITNTFRTRTSSEKLRGYQRALEESDIEFNEERIEEVLNTSLEAGYESLPRLLTRCPDLTAVVTISDPIALGAIMAAPKIGRAVPDDLSVLSGGGSKEGTFFRPTLTDIMHPGQSTAFVDAIVSMVVDMRTDASLAPRTLFEPMSLVVRESTGPPPIE